MPTTTDLDNDIRDLTNQVGDLKAEVATLRGQLEVLTGVAKLGGLVAGVLLLVQTVAIVALAGRSLGVDASTDGVRVGTTTPAGLAAPADP